VQSDSFVRGVAFNRNLEDFHMKSMMMRWVTVATALLLTLAAPAKAQEPNLIQRFTGPYIGLHGGWNYAALKADDGSIRPDGSLLGLQAGYAWAANGIVLGLEGDVSWLNAKETLSNGSDSLTAKLHWLSTVRGRIGLPYGNAMPYLTAGVAFGKSGVSVEMAGSPLGSASKTETGFVYGLGMDVLIDNRWTGRLEALKLKFGDVSYVAGASSVDVDATLIRAGLSYRLN
jgi:outer membrane immunogenic protein